MVREINGLYVDDFYCEPNMMHYWYDRLQELPVQTPDTAIFDLDHGEPEYGEIVRTMQEKDWNHAFIRSDSFSDKINPNNGSHIKQPDRSEVKRTFETLKNHHFNHMGSPMGHFVAVREWLDLSYCPKDLCSNWHPTEIRCFIEGNELQYITPSVSSLKAINRPYDCTFEYLREELMEGPEPPIDEIKVVMNEFTEYAWHVDFCLTTDLEWYCIDMGMDGVYWNKEQEEWVTMCGHDETKEHLMQEKANRVLPQDGI